MKKKYKWLHCLSSVGGQYIRITCYYGAWRNGVAEAVAISWTVFLSESLERTTVIIRLKSLPPSVLWRHITPPTKSGRAPPPTKSNRMCQPCPVCQCLSSPHRSTETAPLEQTLLLMWPDYWNSPPFTVLVRTIFMCIVWRLHDQQLHGLAAYTFTLVFAAICLNWVKGKSRHTFAFRCVFFFFL